MGGIFSINPDGSGLVSLTPEDPSANRPEWSPDGTRFAYISSRGAGNKWNVFVANADGTNVTRLSDHASRHWSYLWSPMGDKLLLTEDAAADIFSPLTSYVANADGTGVINLTKLSGGTVVFSDWSPDGTTLVGASRLGSNDIYNQPDANEIYLISSDGSNFEQISGYGEGNRDIWALDWSPSGEWISFYRQEWGVAEIGRPVNVTSIIKTDGTLHEFDDYYWQLWWSPNGGLLLGEKLYFEGEPYASGNASLSHESLFVLTNDGEIIHASGRWNQTSGWVVEASWSPDNQKLAITRTSGDDDSAFELYIWDLETGILGNVSETSEFREHDPQWSNDSQHVLYSVINSEGEWITRLSRINGSELIELSGLRREEWWPRWQPSSN